MRFSSRKNRWIIDHLIELFPTFSREDQEGLIGAILAVKIYGELRSRRRRGDPIVLEGPILVRLLDGSIEEIPDSVYQVMARTLKIIVEGERGDE